jgi:hypothetical protein
MQKADNLGISPFSLQPASLFNSPKDIPRQLEGDANSLCKLPTECTGQAVTAQVTTTAVHLKGKAQQPGTAADHEKKPHWQPAATKLWSGDKLEFPNRVCCVAYSLV